MQDKLKIVADINIPFLQGVFEPYAEVIYKTGGEIKHEDIIDASCLIIRTRTKCNKELLKNTGIKLISTATIGTDHIDLNWCNHNGILVKNASGCNAGGVMEYVFSALYGTASRKTINLSNKTIGIIGVGNTGERVAKMAVYLGFNVLKYDPPRAEKEGNFEFCDLDSLLKNSDIVTLHVPLNSKTENMADSNFFKKMKKGAFFINSSRGEVVDEAALKSAISKLGPVIIDTWKNEPNIDKELMDMVDVATPHIAGYSYQGKQNGTAAAVRAVARFFEIQPLYDFFPVAESSDNESVKLNLKGMNQGEITALIQYNYPIFTDDFMFRMDCDNFEEFRSNYKYRREIYVDW